MENGSNGPKASIKYIEKQIDDLRERVKDLEDENVELRISMETMKLIHKGKNTAWGVVGGAIPSLSVLIYFIIKQIK